MHASRTGPAQAESAQAGSALIIAAMALLALGLVAVALLRLDGASLALERSHRDGFLAQRIRAAVELRVVRHGGFPAPGPLSWRQLGLAPQDVAGFALAGDCSGWSLTRDGQSWRFPPPSPEGCQALPSGG